MAIEDAQPLDVSKSRFDLKTYFGRWRHFVEVTSPLTLFASGRQLEDAQKLVSDYAAGKRRDLYGKDSQVWKAKQLVDSSIHPETGKPVPLPFRMAAFMPTNLLIMAGMLSPNPTMRSTIFWQVANQTLNVCVNYSNATAGATMTPQEIAAAYFGATSASVALAVGLNQLIPRLRSLSPAAKGLFTQFIPFAAVAGANCVNLSLMRWKEISVGTDIFPPSSPENPNPESLGKSPHAGTLAVSQTAASRVLCNIPCLILPPIGMAYLRNRGLFSGPQGKRIETAANFTIVGVALLLFLPPAIAAFPQRGTVKTSSLEPQFQNIEDPATHRQLDEVEFNKGL